jgi:AcrR family transcriptional regulator
VSTPAPGDPSDLSPRGQRRRAQLLEVLEELLDDRPLAEIEIDDITRRAGITRSGFYFYFPGKSAAVAALIDGIRDGILNLGVDWYDPEAPDGPAQIEVAITNSVAFWREHASLLVAMMDAAAVDEETRADWDAMVAQLAATFAEKFSRDPIASAQLARAGVAVDEFARLLLDSSVGVMERDVRSIVARGTPEPGLVAAMLHLWQVAVWPPAERA